jgi:hypothetical protein
MLKTDGFGGLAREGGTSCITREYIYKGFDVTRKAWAGICKGRTSLVPLSGARRTGLSEPVILMTRHKRLDREGDPQCPLLT